ncbi:MAG: hypothetical protein ACM31L_10705, partial [Actinomycetota bacterium]
LQGYGFAEMAALGSYGLLQLLVQRAVGPVRVGLGMAWAAAFATPLFASRLGELALAGPLLALALPATWKALAGHLAQVTAVLRR